MEPIMDFFHSLPDAAIFIPVFALASVAFFAYYWYAVAPRKGTLEWISMRENRPTRVTFPKCYPMTRRDILPMLLFALCIFILLGSTYNPFIYFRF